MTPMFRSAAICRALAAALLAVVTSSVGRGDPAARWYSAAQAQRGAAVYAAQCAGCHGEWGDGQPNWEQRDEMGFYPAPPLNADGHAWHHPLAQLLEVLDTGGGPAGGTMPSFIDVIDGGGKFDVLAYVQSLWSDEIYGLWVAIDAGRTEPPAVSQHDH